MASEAKERLLSAAVGAFARKGYLGATVAEVCEEAGANIAAVNYHFGSKEHLFRHALREAFAIANGRYPIDGGLPPEAPPEERLRVFMEALIRRSFDAGPAGCFNRIMARALNVESGLEDLIMRELRKLEIGALDPILCELLGTRAPTLIAQARANVIGLSVFPSKGPAVRRLMTGASPRRIRSFIDRQVRFALAGLAALRPESRTRPAAR